MAKPETVRFGKFAVMIASAAAPTIFTAPCGFNSKALELSKELTDVVIPDCDEPDAASWVGRDVASLSASVTGEGVLAGESVKAWLDAYRSIEPVPVKIVLTLLTETITWTGLMHVANVNLSADLGGRVNLNVEMQSDGEMAQVIAPVVP